MSEAKEKGSTRRAMESLSLELNRYPRDLLQRFISSDTQQPLNRAFEQNTEEEIELNLGLSLGGRFGVDKTTEKLTRSSSIAGTIPQIREDDTLMSPPVHHPSLMRASSLPLDTEEKWRKRKKMQTLRRMEVKRRRSEKEKQKNSTPSRPPGVNTEEERRGLRRSTSCLEVKGGFLQVQEQPGSKGSMESYGGSSSLMSEFESQPLPGSTSCGKARSTRNNQSLQEKSSQEVVGSSLMKKNENLFRTSSIDVGELSRKSDTVENQEKEIGTNQMEDMPCVFTKGDGPNGKKIEGILYKYGKQENVRIMCVCHGEFLSPTEFIKHAGGGDVDHPLRHIVVNPSPFS